MDPLLGLLQAINASTPIHIEHWQLDCPGPPLGAKSKVSTQCAMETSAGVLERTEDEAMTALVAPKILLTLTLPWREEHLP